MNKFHATRKSLEMTQAELAERLGVTQSSVSFYEKGGMTPSPEVVGKLIDIAKSRGIELSFDDIYRRRAEKAAA